MNNRKYKLRNFFEEYAKLNNRNNLLAIANYYAPSFIAAGPKGNAAFNNDESFIEWLQQVQAFNSKSGMEAMQIVGYSEAIISPNYMTVDIEWGASFRKTGQELIRFTISYFVYLSDEQPKIVMYIAHEDQTDLMKEKGLL